MAQRSMRGADALVRSLQEAGVRRLFTLSGNHIMPVFDAAQDAGIELIHTRHEAATVHMADAWSRLTGEIGVALVSGGPGHVNAVSALYTAYMAESAVLLLSGHAPCSQLGLGAFQEMQQAEIAKPLTKAAWTSEHANLLSRDLATGWRTAISGRSGPVHISLPTDVLEATITGEGDLLPHDAFTAATQTLALADARALRERLHAAKRPIVLTGPATLTHAGRARLKALEERLCVPVIGMESPRGIADPALGAFAEVLAMADVVLLLGKKLDFTLKFGRPPVFAATCEFMHVDPDDCELARSRTAFGSRLCSAIRADTFSAIEALTRAMPEASSRGSGWHDEVRQAIAYRPSAWDRATAGAGRLHPVQALRPLQQILDRNPDSVLVIDGGEIGQWAQACLSAPRRVINGVAGSIGSALPFALAARIAQPKAPVIAILGDGTFGFHCAEIDTAVRYELPFLAVVGNDARWNAEYQIQLRDYGRERTIGCELLPSRYDKVCIGFGGYGEHVTVAEALLPAVERALNAGLPACLNVMIDGLPAPNIKRWSIFQGQHEIIASGLQFPEGPVAMLDGSIVLVEIARQKTQRPVQFEITEQTRAAVGAWIAAIRLNPEQFLFPSRMSASPHLSTRQYSRIIHTWAESIGLDQAAYGTHSMRRTKPTLIYRRTRNLRAVQLLLGHTKLESTVRYLGIEVHDALEIAEQTEV